MDTQPRTSLPPERLRTLEEALEVHFSHPEYLLHALVHSSAKDESLACNERMEFLGDSVLGMVISEHLFQLFPNHPEGELSSIKSVVVSAHSLAQCAKTLALADHVILGKGILQKKTIPDSVLANALEAVVAAIYLDGGLEPARRFVLRILEPRIEEVLTDRHQKNYKSLLQHLTQKELQSIPAYRVEKESGPDHEKEFEVSVEVAGRRYGPGGGKTKKDAEQQAARIALEQILAERERAV
ncbi:MAG: ribonuclease III [Planctomycetes bacterium]|nr:ribonuclease III [Planctomycetota bacterium]